MFTAFYFQFAPMSLPCNFGSAVLYSGPSDRTARGQRTTLTAFSFLFPSEREIRLWCLTASASRPFSLSCAPSEVLNTHLLPSSSFLFQFQSSKQGPLQGLCLHSCLLSAQFALICPTAGPSTWCCVVLCIGNLSLNNRCFISCNLRGSFLGVPLMHF